MSAHNYVISGEEDALTKKENEMYATLVRLGDSKELALKSVYAERAKGKPDNEFYYSAYCL